MNLVQPVKSIDEEVVALPIIAPSADSLGKILRFLGVYQSGITSDARDFTIESAVST